MATKYYVTDTNLSERFPLYTRANVGEVFPDPVTPLSGGSMLWLAEEGWRDAWVRMGAFDADEFPVDWCQLAVVGGYCYLNASLIRLFGVRAPGLSWQDMDAQFFGAQPGIPDYVEVPGDERLDLTEKIGGTFGYVLSQHSLSALTELTEDRASTKKIRAERPDFSAMTEAELWAKFNQLLPTHRLLFSHHLFATYMATVPVGIISAVATAVGRPDLIMPLIAGIGEVDSAAPSHAMWSLGRLIAGSAQLTAEFNDGVVGLIHRLQSSGSADALAFLAEFDAFLLEFGSRGPNEWEMRSPSWETRPELALSAIDRMRFALTEQDPATMNASRAADREGAAVTLLAMVEADPATHGQLAAGIAATKAWLPGRERTKTNNIRLIHEMRMIMRELGRRMVAKGGFDEIEDFGFIKFEEWEAAMADPTSVTETVRARRAEYNKLMELVPPFVFEHHAEPPSAWARRDAAVENKLGLGDVLQGMPGCSGVVEGRARVILDSNDPTDLDPGDILVAPITDPSWTPLFVPAAGVVVDVGAPLSHAIIVSRELGIPCVISATDATRRIPNGALIRVDGNTGAVTILEMP